jgi:tryptophan 2,3-dioxygenase
MTPETNKSPSYGEYLRVAELTSLQQPLSEPAHHDELLFIIIHQTYELWFKQLLHELDSVISALSEADRNSSRIDSIYEAARLLRRCTEIMRVLVEQFTILETMLPTHFLAFRGNLRPASGFQSDQFRELEFLCGLKDDPDRFRPSPEMAERISRRLSSPSLRDVFFGAIRSALLAPKIDPASDAEYQTRAQLVLAFYKEETKYRHWIDVCERLTEFDELVISWRMRHLQMEARTLLTEF